MNSITFLGTGTSTGVPVTGCNCPTCRSLDSRDKRLRCSALIQTPQSNILIDCSPDFRQQMLNLDFCGSIDAVFITHEHYDHVGGIDDLRPYTYPTPIPLYADAYSVQHLCERLPYCFAEKKYPGVPQVELRTIFPGDTVMVGNTPVTAFQVMHGRLPILGYRIGDLCYITDMSEMPPESVKFLSGAKILVVNALRHQPHHSHQTIEQAISFAHSIGQQPTYIIHTSHHIAPHAQEQSLLPVGINLAYDGLRVEF